MSLVHDNLHSTNMIVQAKQLLGERDVAHVLPLREESTTSSASSPLSVPFKAACYVPKSSGTAMVVPSWLSSASITTSQPYKPFAYLSNPLSQ